MWKAKILEDGKGGFVVNITHNGNRVDDKVFGTKEEAEAEVKIVWAKNPKIKIKKK